MASGGSRPGAGRKSGSTDTYQRTMRGRFEAAVTEQDWDDVIRVALARAKSGDGHARDWLTPWVVGKMPDELHVSGALDVRTVGDLLQGRDRGPQSD